MEAVYVKATCETMADQPVKGGQSLAKKEEHTAKETFDGGPLAQFFFGPGWWQAGAILPSFGIPGDDGNGSQRGMDTVVFLAAVATPTWQSQR